MRIWPNLKRLDEFIANFGADYDVVEVEEPEHEDGEYEASGKQINIFTPFCLTREQQSVMDRLDQAYAVPFDERNASIFRFDGPGMADTVAILEKLGLIAFDEINEPTGSYFNVRMNDLCIAEEEWNEERWARITRNQRLELLVGYEGPGEHGFWSEQNWKYLGRKVQIFLMVKG